MCVRKRRKVPRLLRNDANGLGLQYVMAAAVIGIAVAQNCLFKDAVSLKFIVFGPTALTGIPVFVVAILELVRWRELVILVGRISFA